MLRTFTEETPKPERDRARKELRRARRLCNGLTRCIIREDWKRYKIWRKMHAKFYELDGIQ